MERPGIILGLGNPGPRYEPTRHNLGFRVVDRLAEMQGAAFRVDGFFSRQAWTARIERPGGLVVLAKPRTYMNRSGRAAASLCRRYGISPRRLLVVFDDADLQLGRIRLRARGSAGGHRGLISLVEGLRSNDFLRLKLGVRGAGREDQELADYVLSAFGPREGPIAEALVDLGAQAALAAVDGDFNAAMSRFNGRTAEASDPGPSGRELE